MVTTPACVTRTIPLEWLRGVAGLDKVQAHRASLDCFGMLTKLPLLKVYAAM